MVKVHWKGKVIEIEASNIRDLLKCLRKCYPELQDLIRPSGDPSPLLLVFVNSRELSVLEDSKLRGDEEIDLIPVLHRG